MVGIMLHFYFCQVLLIHLQVCFRAPRQFVKVVEDFVETRVDALSFSISRFRILNIHFEALYLAWAR